ncbi:SSI family serine proteinase inhibitor [Streptomyces sp. S.PB5]|uniref:SSI family serine proteinase inhibitor n=1 Tax=Streptomyces sp. S.PB5 TaxID=3020844 RepID=UPI0025B10439|nr:SSI family serine proteinase inhibitor [Streptomyces sp. S.PB5]MDN3021676.1 SSI family serine proteinase inhibitor [Streptomyces sp. S.PB5]
MKNCTTANRTTASRTARGALLAAAALLAAGTVPAQAAPQDSRTGNWLYLTVTKGDTRGTLLLCDPPRGHGKAAEACAELDSVNGDIAALPPKETYCPMIYAPVTARARGQWDGRPVEYAETFSNGCVMTARTGSVFALDSGCDSGSVVRGVGGLGSLHG